MSWSESPARGLDGHENNIDLVQNCTRSRHNDYWKIVTLSVKHSLVLIYIKTQMRLLAKIQHSPRSTYRKTVL